MDTRPAAAPRQVASTGITGLDDILSGGLTRRRLYLIEGVPGSGKTTLALQFLLAGVSAGERVLYITLSETADELASVAEAHGYNVARGFCGHGLGRRCWEDPQVPFAGKAGTGPLLVEGMVITVEPVVIEGDKEFAMANRWEARTVDHSLVAQFERAVMVTAQGGLILSGD